MATGRITVANSRMKLSIFNDITSKYMPRIPMTPLTRGIEEQCRTLVKISVCNEV